MVRDPVARDVDPPADPDVRVLLDVVEEPLERRKAPRAPDQPHVEANRHHLRASALAARQNAPLSPELERF